MSTLPKLVECPVCMILDGIVATKPAHAVERSVAFAIVACELHGADAVVKAICKTHMAYLDESKKARAAVIAAHDALEARKPS